MPTTAMGSWRRALARLELAPPCRRGRPSGALRAARRSRRARRRSRSGSPPSRSRRAARARPARRRRPVAGAPATAAGSARGRRRGRHRPAGGRRPRCAARRWSTRAVTLGCSNSSVAGSSASMATPRRLRSSTAISESRPRSCRGWPSSMCSTSSTSSTRAARRRTSSRSASRRRRSGRRQQLARCEAAAHRRRLTVAPAPPARSAARRSRYSDGSVAGGEADEDVAPVRRVDERPAPGPSLGDASPREHPLEHGQALLGGEGAGRCCRCRGRRRRRRRSTHPSRC